MEVFPEDEGEYVCIGQNPAGEASTRMYLSVLDSAPTVEADLEDETMAPEQGEITEEDVIPKVPLRSLHLSNI